jgi:hypothetical protein
VRVPRRHERGGPTLEVVDTLRSLDVNSAAVGDGAVWVVSPSTNVLQRFDLHR